MRERARFLLVLAVVATAVSVVAVSAFGHAGNNGANAIHACVNTSSGALYIVTDGTEECRSGFEPLHWSITGPQGEPGLSGYEMIEGQPITHGPGPFGVSAYCSDDKKPLGGGHISTQADVTVYDSYPVDPVGPIAGWNLGVYATGTTTITPYVVCAYVAN